MSLGTTIIFLEPMWDHPDTFTRAYTNRSKVDHNHPAVTRDLLSWGPWVLKVRVSNDEFV